MDNKFTIKERMLQLAKFKNLTMEDFCNRIDMSYANFKGEAKKRPINSNTVVKLFTTFPDISLKWLLIGEGAMIEASYATEHKTANKSDNQELINYLKEKLKQKEEALQDCYREIGRLEGQLDNNKKERKAG
ncbi:MAG: hypothetical protein R6U66_08970 [Bacteroidales bacterium]